MPFSPKLAVFVALLFLTGCASHKLEVTQTGFLANYDQLVQSETFEGMRIYRNDAVNIKETYSKIMLAPVEIKLAADMDAKKFNEDEQAKLATYLHDSLEKKLAAAHFEMTNEVGPGVLLLRAAITDVLANKVYLNLHWSTTLLGAGIGGASIEAELIDAQSNDRILAFTDAMKGKRFNYTKGLTKWGHTKEVLDKWADILVKNLSELEKEPQAIADGP